MTIYEPVTDIGKAIAKALTKDDGIRLDIHDILEKWEGSLKNIEEHPHRYNPEEAIRIAESTYPLLFSGRYVLSNMRQMKEKAENWDAFKGVVPSDSKLFVVKPEYAHMSRGDMASRLGAFKAHLDAVNKDPQLRWNISHNGFNELMENLYEILEASE